MNKIRICHIINGLGTGGAENMLYKLLSYTDTNRFEHTIISLLDMGQYGEKIRRLGFEVITMNISIKNIYNSIKTIKQTCVNVDIINTWLYYSDIIGYIVGKILLNKKVIWNIRHSNLDFNVNKKKTFMLIRFNSILSKKVDKIIYNSYTALKNHEEIGYENPNSIVIPNGFDLNEFYFDVDARNEYRKFYDLKENIIFITVGRWDIQKDYYTLLESINLVRQKNNKFKLFMVGNNLDDKNIELLNLIRKYSLEDYIILMGKRDDIRELMSMADVYVSSSLGESFSNSIAEAMCCEINLIVTDVGDNGVLLNCDENIVEPNNPMQLKECLNRMIKNNLTRNKSLRDIIKRKYRIERIILLYENTYLL